MRKIRLLILAIPFLMLFYGCPYGFRYDTGKFPAQPVNFTALNSIYDDYNMTSPVIEGYRYLYYSTNRNSGGGDFDVVGNTAHIFWDKDKGTLEVNTKQYPWKDLDYVDSLFIMVNTPADELGPYSLPFYTYDQPSSDYYDIMIYSSNTGGDLDLRFAYFTAPGNDPSYLQGQLFGPFDVYVLNSPSDDAYLCFYGPGMVHYDHGLDVSLLREAYFCSDLSGDFEIYYEKFPEGLGVLDYLLQESAGQPMPVEVLNSASQDKCPYIDGELLVFASDRPGGYGGFDLYYSRRQGASWSEPVNFGERINTAYDEYRPIVASFGEFDNDMLLFSSNRPGGQGGFDLYYVGIPRMIY